MKIITIEKSTNMALMINELAAQLDENYIGSDGMVNGEPSFQWDFNYGGATHRLHLISTIDKHESN